MKENEADNQPSTSQQEEDDSGVKLSQEYLRQAAGLIRASNALPRLGDTYEMCSSFGKFGELMEHSRGRLAILLHKLYSAVGVKIRLPREKDTNEFLDRIVDANDIVMERTGILIDEITKAHRKDAVLVPKSISQAESTIRSVQGITSSSTSSPLGLPVPIMSSPKLDIGQIAKLRVLARHNEMIGKVVQIKKPQKEFGFEKYIDNSSAPFVNKLLIKHHEYQPAKAQGITVVEDESLNNADTSWLNDESTEGNPYLPELEHFVVPPSQMKSAEIQPYKSIEETPLVYIDTRDKLEELKNVLNACSIFAVDLEHHDYRSFLGFTCLIQISTRESDYIVDPFVLWGDLSILNEPFTDPKILKIFHGADRDVIWLQRDFGIYIVNMFDTGRAARHLGLPKHGLQFLVEHFCNVQLNKEFQTTDWRLRPLPEEMLLYAREDTHYLIFCYEQLRERLIHAGNEQTNNLLEIVYKDSKEICKKVYEKPVFDANGFAQLLMAKRNFNNRQLFAMREIWRWRDATARNQDESLGYVLPPHMMIHIAEALPRDMQGILACCSPVPVPLKEHLLIIHRIILEARDRPLEIAIDGMTKVATEGETLAAMRNRRQQSNVIDGVKGRLYTHLHMHFDEKDHVINRSLEKGEDAEIVEATDNEILESILMSALPADIQQGIIRAFTESLPIYDLKKKSRAISKAHKLLNQLSEVASPYECYQLAIQERDKRIEAQRAEDKEKTAETPKEPRYSHHDPAISRKPIWEEDVANTSNEVPQVKTEVDEETPAAETSLMENQILTKKALKRKMQQAKQASDLQLSGTAPKAPKQEVALPVDFQAVDYSSYSTKMFEQGHKRNHGYDPFNEGQSSGDGRRGGRGGRHQRGRGRATFRGSRRPNQQKNTFR